MAKSGARFVCQECGGVHKKWSGQCGECGAWDTLVEETTGASFRKTNLDKPGSVITLYDLQGEAEHAPRVQTDISELDRVLGGGLVRGSAVLIGGDPGIGKSTLLLQLAAQLTKQGQRCLYITGEESVDQVRLRGKRLGAADAPLKLAAATAVGDILATLHKEKPDIVIIDSIQTMFVQGVESAPGSVSQVRISAHELIGQCKQTGTSLLLVGHVTKEGQIAGPKVLEHMVDTVLYFEGDRGHQFRIIRAVKNRFGAANEIGVFEMSDSGLKEVENPSSLFLSGHVEHTSGTVIFAGIEGTRPVMVEIQALVAPTMMATPRRAVVGWDNSRLAMILAVLQTRAGIQFADKEVYLNVAGGFKIAEPAADMAVAAALISAVAGVPMAEGMVVFGEIGLAGEIRKVSQAPVRLKEAAKLGFTRALTPLDSGTASGGFCCQTIQDINTLKQAVLQSGGSEIPAMGAVG